MILDTSQSQKLIETDISAHIRKDIGKLSVV